MGRASIRGVLAGAATCIALLASAAGANAAADIHLQPVAELAETTSVVSSPAEPSRLFITTVNGEIFSDDEGVTEPLVDLSPLVQPKSENGEQALNSMVLAPDFATNRRFYVDYVSRSKPGENIVLAELIDRGTPEQIFASHRTVLEIAHPETSHHFSGDLQFGPEGDLFISTGDSYPPPNFPDHSPAQDLSSPLGKILRIDPTPEGVEPFTIPADNPFVSTPGANPMIWSRGLRNPFRFTIDRLTSNLIIGDVGEEKWEELDLGVGGGSAGPVGGAGANYGWPCYEGPEPFTPKAIPACEHEEPPFTQPMLAYEHHDSQAPFCTSVISGYVEHDPTVAALDDRLIYGDFCSGAISSVTPAPTTTDNRAETELSLSLRAGEEARTGKTGEETSYYKLQSFGEDGCGRVYILAGAVYRIAGETPADCGNLHVDVRGSGSVSGAGISCPGTCDRTFTAADSFASPALTPSTASGWHFVGWEGDCSGSGSCAPQMSADRVVTAVFAQDQSPPPPPPPGSTTKPAEVTPEKPKIGGFKVNKTKGTGTLVVTVHKPGTVKLTGKGIVAIKRSAPGGRLSLPVKPTKGTRKTLAAKGRYSAKLTIAFTPRGGSVAKATRKVTLHLK